MADERDEELAPRGIIVSDNKWKQMIRTEELVRRASLALPQHSPKRSPCDPFPHSLVASSP